MLHGCRFFFFKQKTAYEMRISDWSSDVCSSDLTGLDALRDDGVDAGFCCDACLVGIRHGRQQDDAGLLERGDVGGRRQAEMKTEHGRLFGQQHCQHCVVDDEAGVDLALRRWWTRFEFSEQRLQMGSRKRVVEGKGEKVRVDLGG